MTAEQLEQLKARCEEAMQRSVITFPDRYMKIKPRTVLDLIAEVERQAEYIANLKHDMDATVKFCDEHHRGE